MLYKYSDKLLGFVQVTWHIKLLLLVILIAIIVIVGVIINFSVSLDNKYIEKQVIIVMAKQNQFTNEKLIIKINEMNFHFPYIVYGQAILETNYFKSKIFVENNNLFGMKEATQRVNVARGTQSEHAYYTNWFDSLYDYGLYYSTYLSKLTTEDDYYSYLSQYYAEDTSYVSKIKNIIQNENLKSKFK